MRASLALLLLALFLGALPSSAVLFASTSDPGFNTTPPGGSLQGSGWDFEGSLDTKVGTPISERCFVTAAHIGGTAGDSFVFGGRTYVTDRVDTDPNGDLAIWHVTTPFPTWAPLYRSSDELGRNLVVFGRGTQRGGDVIVGGTLRGWFWGEGDSVQRWGTNTVSALLEGTPDLGSLLVAEFNPGVSSTEAHLSVGDSGAGVFIQDSDGVWKLAGVGIDVDGYYATDAAGTLLPSSWAGLAALFDTSDLFLDGYTGVWVPASGPGRWYATRISPRADFIDSLCPPAVPGGWSNGPDTSPDYFPIGVWLQDEADAATWAAAGVNLYIGLWQGPTTAQLDALRAAGMQAVAAQNAAGLAYDLALPGGRPVLVGWSLPDEPDNYPKTPAAQIQAQAAQWRLADPTRPLFLNLSQGLGWDDATWVGQGGQIVPAVDYPAYLAAGDIAAFDIYPSSETHAEVQGDLWRVALGVDRLFQYRPGQQGVWSFIETGNVTGITPDRRPTPEQIRAEVWMSVLHGAQGIVYFIHGKTSVSDFDDRALLRPENAAYLSAVTNIDAELRGLAPVIHAPASDVVSVEDVVGSSPVEFTARSPEGIVHVFAVGMRDAPTRKRFAISPPADGSVEVLGEARSLPMSAGRFEDDFDGYQAHLYRVAVVPEPAAPLAIAAAIGVLAVLTRRRARRSL